MNLKILFITQDDPFYVKIFFEEFFVIYEDIRSIKAVVIARAMGKKSMFQLARQMYEFYGFFNFLRMGVRFVGYKVGGLGLPFTKTNSAYTLDRLCRLHGVPVMHESGINSSQFLQRVEEMGIDLIISVAAPSIFKEGLIRIPRLGCINIHNGMLPNYRGMLPNFWQMYHNEKAAGITIHEISAGIDEGRIIAQKQVPIAPEETLDSLIKKTKSIGAHLMKETIQKIESGSAHYKENRVEEGSYFSFPTRQDVREFRRRGKRIV
ncbi:MAG: formyl transferase [Deltaproteobacteria bacterium]|nr:formyl transferase [Deltaproteobacteria bacterium]